MDENKRRWTTAPGLLVDLDAVFSLCHTLHQALFGLRGCAYQQAHDEQTSGQSVSDVGV
jgi:hypothetical protein